jgi:hypothetical protein
MAFNLFINTVDTKGKLQSSVAPSAANDLANKAYVDANAGSGDWIDSVISQLAAAVATPAANARYLVQAAPSGTAITNAWFNSANKVAQFNGGSNAGTDASAWDFTTPTEGTHVFIETDGGGSGTNADTQVVYNGTAWVVGGSLAGALVVSQELAEFTTVTQKSNARTNLGLGTVATESTVPVLKGGTGATTAAGARTNIGAASSGANTDITSITGLTTDLAIAQGGTGADTKPAAFDALSPMSAAADIIVGGASGSGGRLAAGTVGQVLTVATGAATLEWAAAGGAGTVTSVGFKDDDGDTYSVTTSGNVTIQGATDSNITSDINTATGVLSLDMSKSTAALSGATSTIGRAGFSSADFGVTAGFVTIKAAGVDLTAQVTGTLPAGNGGTGLTSIATLLNSAVTAGTLGLGTTDSPQFLAVNVGHASDTTITRSTAGNIAVEGNLVYRAAGTDVPVTDGGTGASTAAAARTNLGLGTMATQAAAAVAITGGAVTGITDLTIADGGTGKSTALLAFDALSPTSTRGDIIYNNGTNNARLAIGTDGQFLKASFSGGNTDPVYASITASDLSSAIATASGQGDKLVQTDAGSAPGTNELLVLSSSGRLKAATTIKKTLEVSQPTGATGTTKNLSLSSGLESNQIQVLDTATNSCTAVSTFNLPAATLALKGSSFTFKVLGGMAASNQMNITPSGTETIDGEGAGVAVPLSQDYQSVTCTILAAGKWIMS